MNIPKTCRAAVMEKYNEPIQIKEVPVPEITGKGVLVKVLLAGICGTDLHQHSGDFANTLGRVFPPPYIQGHETLGEIVKLGPDRIHDLAGEPLKVGDRIMWSHDFCGECYACAVLRQPFMCTNNRGYGFANPDKLMGGFAEYEVILPTTPIVRVPDEVLDEEAVGVGCAFRTVINAFDKLQHKSPINLADTVVVQGCGPIGLYALACAIASGAGQTIVIGAPAGRLQLAKEWGATHVIDIDEVKDPTEREKMVRGWTEGRGAEVVIECSGWPPAFNEGFGLMMNSGTYLIIGQTTDKKIEFMPYNFLMRNATVIGSGSADIVHFYRALKFIKYNRTKFPLGAIVSKKYKLEEINEALEGMRQGSEIKAVIDNR